MANVDTTPRPAAQGTAIAVDSVDCPDARPTGVRRFARAFSRLVTLSFIVVLALVAFVTVSPGYGMYKVVSGSMAPTIDPGDLIVTGPAGGLLSPSIEPGAIVSYMVNDALVTHRVLSTSGDLIVTKGDAVEDPDPEPVPVSRVVGTYVLRIPKLGYLSSFIRTPVGWGVVIILPSVVLVLMMILALWKEVAVGSAVRP